MWSINITASCDDNWKLKRVFDSKTMERSNNNDYLKISSFKIWALLVKQFHTP